MKLIIDIDDDVYADIKEGYYYEYVRTMAIAIGNGIPLEDIRAEISNIPQTDSDGHSGNWYREPQAIIDDVIEIIDKYKAESEE